MFYKLLESNELIYGPFVHNENYILLEQDHLNYEYPIDGYYWFDTLEEANTFFNITIG